MRFDVPPRSMLNLSLLGAVLEGQRPAVLLVESLPGLSIAFAVEPLGMLFALIATNATPFDS